MGGLKPGENDSSCRKTGRKVEDLKRENFAINFQLSVKNNFMIAFVLPTLYQPIRSKTKTNHINLLTHVIPLLAPAACICFEV